MRVDSPPPSSCGQSKTSDSMTRSNYHARRRFRKASASSSNAPVLPHFAPRPRASWTTLPHHLKEKVFEHYFALFPQAVFEPEKDRWSREKAVIEAEKLWMDKKYRDPEDVRYHQNGRQAKVEWERYVRQGKVPYWTPGRVNKEFDEFIAAKMWTGQELFHGSRLALLINPQNSLKIVCQNFYNSCAHSPVLDTIALHLPNVETVDVEGPGLSFDSSADPVLWNTPSLRRLYIKTAFGDTYPA